MSKHPVLEMTLLSGSMAMIVCSIFLPFLLPLARAQFSEERITIEISLNGEARITEEISVDTTLPQIKVSPIALSLENLLAVDESNIILRAVLIDDAIRIDTLGAAQVTLTYDAAIVNQSNDIWNIEYASPIESRILLPSGSELLFVNTIPIDIVGNVVVMPPDEIKMSYRTRTTSTDSFVVAHNGTDFRVGIVGTSKIKDLEFDFSRKSIIISVDSQEPILVMIPRDLLGGPYDVSTGDGQNVQFKEYYQNVSHSWIRVETPASASSLRITGTTVIPEFNLSSILVVGVAIGSIVLLSTLLTGKGYKSWSKRG